MVARRHSKKNPDVLLSSGSFFTFPWRFLRHCRRPTNDLAFLRRAPLHRFASRLLFIYPGTNGRRTADVGGQRRRTTLLVPHKRDTRISILALTRFGLSSLLLRTTVVKEIRREACPERNSLKHCASGSDSRRVPQFDWLFRCWIFLPRFVRFQRDTVNEELRFQFADRSRMFRIRCWIRSVLICVYRSWTW